MRSLNPKVSNMKIPLLGESMKVKISDDERELVSLAKRRLFENTGYPVEDIGSSEIFRSIDVFRYDNLLFFYLHQKFTRPLKYYLVCVDTEHRSVLSPSSSSRDFVTVIHMMNLLTIQDIVTFDSICHRLYGVVEKNCIPLQIESVDDAIGHGIRDDKVESLLPLSNNRTLWWQKWGGSIFTFQFEEDANPPCVAVEYKSFYQGNYLELPRAETM